MAHTIYFRVQRQWHLRSGAGRRSFGLLCLCCCLVLSFSCAVVRAQDSPDSQAQTARPDSSQPAQSAAAPASAPESSGSDRTAPSSGAHTIAPAPSARQRRQAEDAYLAGAKKLEHDDLDAAEREFKRALALDPEDRDYAIAISVTRQHRLTELVQQAGKARQAGDPARADTLFAEARALDPQNPIVIEHMSPALIRSAAQPPADSPPVAVTAAISGQADPLSDRTQMLSPDAGAPWIVQAPELGGPIRLKPTDAKQSFHLRGVSEDVLRDVASSYGIRTVFDPSVERKTVRIDLEDVRYGQAMSILTSMTHVFAVPLDETTLLVAKDDSANRQSLEHQSEETIYLPGWSADRLNELAAIIRNVFDLKQVVVQATLGNIIVRAPEEVLAPMNRAVEGLMDDDGEVMVEVKMYEIDTTRMNDAGTTLPTQLSVFNVDQAASSVVNANQALVQQAIAQGYISANATNLQIAIALIASGLVKNSLAANLIGVFGGGVFQTGISASTNTQFNLGLNSSDTRSLDDVQMRIGDRQLATFREGTRYPIVSSTYTSGISTAGSALSNASINGVSVASLLSQYAGGSSATIPQVTYEDLGITLNATPTIQKSGRVNLLLNLKIVALAGSSANGNPILANRQMSSDITVADGESAMLVSAVSRTETVAMTGIPGLSELPGFQLPIEQNTEKDSSQLVMLVTPHIVRRRSDVIAGPLIRLPNLPTN